MSTSILPLIQIQMNFYAYPIVLVVGNIGNIFTLIIFYRQKRNACSIYLMNSAVTNILYLTISGLFRIYSYSYTDDTMRSLILCRLSMFIPSFLGQVTKTLLIFACIDRYMITSSRTSFRAFSTLKRAKYFTFFIFLFWTIAASHTLIWLNMNNGQCATSGNYGTFYGFYAVIFIGLVPSIIICVFAYLTYKNMKQLRNRIQSTGLELNQRNNCLKRRDRDLLILVMSEVIIYIITTSPMTIMYLERMITQFILPNKSVQLLQIEYFALNATFLMIFIFSAAPFYTYYISSASFREDWKQLILTNYQKIRHINVDHSVSRRHQTVIR